VERRNPVPVIASRMNTKTTAVAQPVHPRSRGVALRTTLAPQPVQTEAVFGRQRGSERADQRLHRDTFAGGASDSAG
jgi:hypothetical protein